MLDEVTGESLAWGEVTLDEPVVTQTGIVYAIFELPAYEERTGIGADGGPGIGYTRRSRPAGLHVRRRPDLGAAEPGAAVGGRVVLTGASRCAVALKSFDEARAPARLAGGMISVRAGRQHRRSNRRAGAPSLVHAGRRLAAVPNPFNPRTEVHFFVSRAGKVEVDVYDVRGRLVDRLVHEDYAPGAHSITWNGTDHADRSVASGVYYLRMESPDGASDIRVTLVR